MEVRKNSKSPKKRTNDSGNQPCISSGQNEIFRLLKQARETGDISPKTYLRGRKPVLDKAALLELKSLKNSCPDITLAEIKGKLKLTISVVCIHNAVPMALSAVSLQDAMDWFACAGYQSSFVKLL